MTVRCPACSQVQELHDMLRAKCRLCNADILKIKSATGKVVCAVCSNPVADENHVCSLVFNFTAKSDGEYVPPT